MDVYIDQRVKKIYLPDKGYAYIAINHIPPNTIIIKETPITIKDENIISDIFQLLYTIFNSSNEIINKFKKLLPRTLDHYQVNKNKITEELNKIKLNNSMLYNFFLDNFTLNEIYLYCAKYSCNAFDYQGKPAILFNATILNHSCLPNVIFGKENNQICFITIRDIKKGEEIYDNYIDITLTRTERQRQLKEQYGFVCHCVRCVEYNSTQNVKYDQEVIEIEHTRQRIFNHSKSKLIF